jgi:DNA polymerase-3 subunit delta'
VAAQIVRQAAEVDGYDAARLVRMAGGAPGLAIRLAAMKALEVDDAAHEILTHLDHPQPAALLSLADGFRGAEGAERFQLLFERLADRIRTMAVDQALAGTGEGYDLDRWAEAWETLMRLPREAEAVNLDRADSFWTAIRALKAAAA